MASIFETGEPVPVIRGQDGAHLCASLLQMWPSVSHGLHLSTYPTYQLFVCGKCFPWSWKTGGLACDRLRVRMHDVGGVDKYHYLQRDMRKGRNAGAGDGVLVVAPPLADLLHSRTLQARHCVGGLGT